MTNSSLLLLFFSSGERCVNRVGSGLLEHWLTASVSAASFPGIPA